MKKILIIATLSLTIIVLLWLVFKPKVSPPQFLGISDIEVISSNAQATEIKANIRLYNPNKINAQLINTELSVLTDEVKFANISQVNISTIEPETEFKVPLKFNIDLVKFGSLQGLSRLLEKLLNENRQIPVKFSGYCRLRIDEDIYKIPIDYDETITLK